MKGQRDVSYVWLRRHAVLESMWAEVDCIDPAGPAQPVLRHPSGTRWVTVGRIRNWSGIIAASPFPSHDSIIKGEFIAQADGW